MRAEPNINDRDISLGDGLPAIPERLLLAHARGQVLFICGAGISKPAALPDFRKLVLEVYQKLDAGVHAIIASLPSDACNKWEPDSSGLTERQTAEVKRFILGDYDVVLGMLERRLDDTTRGDSTVRREVATLLRDRGNKPAPIHRALIRLSDRGGAVAIITTNFASCWRRPENICGLRWSLIRWVQSPARQGGQISRGCSISTVH